MTSDKPNAVASNALLAERITMALCSRPCYAGEQELKDRAWIFNRYGELRIVHPDGFTGADYQAKLEFVLMVLNTANPSFQGGGTL